jgi:hypothetical protein
VNEGRERGKGGGGRKGGEVKEWKKVKTLTTITSLLQFFSGGEEAPLKKLKCASDPEIMGEKGASSCDERNDFAPFFSSFGLPLPPPSPHPSLLRTFSSFPFCQRSDHERERERLVIFPLASSFLPSFLPSMPFLPRLPSPFL